eukprot:365566-Chlamydomonas_euryale.AAC.17
MPQLHVKFRVKVGRGARPCERVYIPGTSSSSCDPVLSSCSCDPVLSSFVPCGGRMEQVKLRQGHRNMKDVSGVHACTPGDPWVP